jgi:hypothetical protein
MILVAFGAPEHDFWLVKLSQRANTLHAFPCDGAFQCRERLLVWAVRSTKDDSFNMIAETSPETMDSSVSG